MPLRPNPAQAIQGLQDFGNPALTYQAQAPDRRIPAIEQTWGPYLDIIHQSGGKLQDGPSPANSNQLRGFSQQPAELESPFVGQYSGGPFGQDKSQDPSFQPHKAILAGLKGLR